MTNHQFIEEVAQPGKVHFFRRSRIRKGIEVLAHVLGGDLMQFESETPAPREKLMNGVPVIPACIRVAQAAEEEFFVGKPCSTAGSGYQARQIRRQLCCRHESRAAWPDLKLSSRAVPFPRWSFMLLTNRSASPGAKHALGLPSRCKPIRTVSPQSKHLVLSGRFLSTVAD